MTRSINISQCLDTALYVIHIVTGCHGGLVDWWMVEGCIYLVNSGCYVGNDLVREGEGIFGIIWKYVRILFS